MVDVIVHTAMVREIKVDFCRKIIVKKAVSITGFDKFLKTDML